MQKSLFVAISAVFSLVFIAVEAQARPPRPIPHVNVTVTLKGCVPAKNDVFVRVGLTGAASYPQTTAALTDGSIRASFSFIGVDVEEENFIPRTYYVGLKAGVCPGGSFSPTSAVYNFPGNANLSFTYTRVGPRRVHISALDLANEVNTRLATAQLRLHNYQSQGTYVSLFGVQVPFTIDAVRVDVDCGILCPDLGDALFYVNDINLSTAHLGWSSGMYQMLLNFEDGAREIKGLHNVLGDNGIPDFELQNLVLKIAAKPIATVGDTATIDLSGVALSANISSTGGCHLAGFDICNALLGTNGKIKRGIEQATMKALGNATLRAMIRQVVMQYLNDHGVNSGVVSVSSQGNDLIIATL